MSFWPFDVGLILWLVACPVCGIVSWQSFWILWILDQLEQCAETKHDLLEPELYKLSMSISSHFRTKQQTPTAKIFTLVVNFFGIAVCRRSTGLTWTLQVLLGLKRPRPDFFRVLLMMDDLKGFAARTWVPPLAIWLVMTLCRVQDVNGYLSLLFQLFCLACLDQGIYGVGGTGTMVWHSAVFSTRQSYQDLMPPRCGRSRTLSAKPKIPSIRFWKQKGPWRDLERPLADVKTD